MDRQQKKNLLPSKKDDACIDELYWQLRHFCYLAGNCQQNPHMLNHWWAEVDFYEILEIIVYHTISNINNS
jgi:hypothetical protein